MTKLEELDEVYEAKIMACQIARHALDMADYERMLASEAYYAELKYQEEKQNELALSTNEAHGD